MAQNDRWKSGIPVADDASGGERWKTGTPVDDPKPKENILGDIASTAVKGVIAVPEAITGLADIFTGGRAGKALEDLGVRFKDAKEVASSWESDATKQARQEFDQAEGLVGKAQAALSNPRLIAMGIGESVPSMLAGGALARTAGVALPSLAGRVGLTAAGEGAVMAGSQAEQIRQQTEDGLLTGKQAGLAAATGVVGGTLGALGGRAAKALGVGDVDQMAATGIVQNASRPGLGIASRAGRGALTEGVFEELPQSLAETGLQNLALDRPFTQDMDSAAVMGTLTGGAMGAGAGVLSGMGQRPQSQPQPVTGTGAPSTDSPIVGTSTVEVDGKVSTKVNRQDGSVDIDGVQVVPPTASVESDSTLPVDDVIDVEPITPVKPSEAMGIDRAAGPLSRAAADAVDSGASPVVPPVNPLVQAAQSQAVNGPLRKTYGEASKDWVKAGKRGDVIREGDKFRFAADGTPELDSWKARFKKPDESVQSDAQPVEQSEVIQDEVQVDAQVEANPSVAQEENRSREVGGASGNGGVNGTNVGADSPTTEQAADPDKQPVVTKVKPAAIMRDMAQQFRDRFAKTQKDSDRTFASVLDKFASDVEQGKRDPASMQEALTRYAEILATPVVKKNQLEPAQDDTEVDANGLSDTGVPAVTGAGAGDTQRPSGVSDAGRVRGRPGKRAVAPADAKLAQGGADRTGDGRPGTGDGTAALNGRPARWRQNALQAKKVARSLGLNPDGKRLAEIVAEVDAFDAGDMRTARQRLTDARNIDAKTNNVLDALYSMSNGIDPDEDMLGIVERAADDMSDDVKSKVRQAIKESTQKVKGGRVVSDAGKFTQLVGEAFAYNLDVLRRSLNTNVQDTPQGTSRTEAQAPADQAPEAARGDGAEAGRVPDTRAGDGVRADGVEGITKTILESIADQAKKTNRKYYDKQIAKGLMTRDEADRRIANDDKMWAEQKVNDRTERIAKAIAEKDPTVLVGAWAKEGQGTYGNEGSMEAFRKLTGINLARMNSADRAKAIFDWAGWSEDQVRTDVEKRRAERNEQIAKAEEKRKQDDAAGIERLAASTKLTIEGQDGETTVKAYIDGLIEQGYTEIGQTKVGAIKRTLLFRPGANSGYPMRSGILADYAKVASDRFKAQQPPAQETKPSEKKAQEPKATELTPKQYHEAKLKFIADENGVSLAEVREMYDTEGGRADNNREWLREIEAAAGRGEVLTRQTLDKLYELAPNARMPESAFPDGYQKPEARKAEAEEKQARIDNRKEANESVKRDAAETERFEAGRSLTKEQRREVLASLVDVYKAKGADREMKGVDQNGNERYGYVHSPDLFEKSDITGSMVRYYVTLPDGRKAHPTELFPDVSASDVERMALEQEEKRNKAEAYRRALKPVYSDFDAARLIAGNGQVVISDGTEFAVIPDRPGPVGQARGFGWNVVDKPTPQQQEAAEQPQQESKRGLTGVRAKRAAEAEAKRADYFTPGNIVKGYGGYDRVLEYTPVDERGSWSVRVQRVLEQGDQFIDEPNERPRWHSTQPEPKEFAAGPVQRAPVTPQQADKQGEKKPAEKIEDFGEKLPPSRRAMAAKLSEAISDEDIAVQPLSKIWPVEENEAIEDTFAAAVAHVMREAIPAKPRKGYKLNSWVGKVKVLRDFAAKILRGTVSRETFLSEMDKLSSLRDMRSKIKLLEQIDRAQWKRIGEVSEAPGAITYVDGKAVPQPSASVTVDGKSHWLRNSGDINDHVGTIKTMLEGDAPESKLKFEVFRATTGDRKVFISKKGDKEYRRLMEFDTPEQARKALKDQYAELVAAWEGIKSRDNITERDLRTSDNRPRSGKDWRKGKDVSAEEFQAQFGFRGGEFGKWVSQGKGAQERQFMLNNAYDALMDLSEILGVPPKAISLDGSLGIAFGSRGGGWASAHFEPSNLVINLTKPRGAGALAHEWFHALDNYFARKRNGGEVPIRAGVDAQNEYRRNNYITHKTRPMMVRKDGRGSPVTRERLTEWRKSSPDSAYLAADQWIEDPNHKQGVRAEVEERFDELVKALDASPMLQRARTLDGVKSGDGYWSRTLERAARSFENYVQTRMMEQGYHNDFLANVKAAPDVGKNVNRYPYLLPSEVAPIADAFGNLFQTIQTRETDDGNVEMYYGTKENSRQGTPVDRSVMDMAGEGRDANDILSFIANTSKSPYRRNLARKLLATGANPAVSLGGEMGGGAGFRFLAKYSRKNHEVTLSEAAGDRAEQIFLHETVHAATLLALDKGGLQAQQMIRLYESAKKQGLAEGQYGMKNVGEFVAEAFTNPEFQKILKSMKAPEGNLWKRFVALVRRILGMSDGSQDMLTAALEVGARVMRENMPLRAARSFRAEDGPAFAGSMNAMPENQAPGPKGDAQQGADKGNAVADGFVRLYHGGGQGVTEILEGGSFNRFDGLFASGSRKSAMSHGIGSMYYMDIPEDRMLTQRMLDYEIDNDKVSQALRSEMHWLDDADFDIAYEAVIEDRHNQMDEDSLIRVFREDDFGSASWEAQRIRGRVAKALGYLAVEMKDEHGTSYLVLPGVKVNPLNDQSAPDTDGADDAFFGIADASPNNAREAVKQFDLKQMPRNTWGHYRGMLMQALGRRQIVDLYREELPQLVEYDRLVQQMDAEKNDTGAEADKLATEWGKLDRVTKKEGEERRLAELMHDATLAQIDPEKEFVAGDNRLKYGELKARFDSLTPEAQTIYRQTRDMYSDHYNKVREAIKDRIERSELSASRKKEMMAKMDDDFFKKVKGVYFPLARFGNYVMVTKDAAGDVVNVTRAETLNEAQEARRQIMSAFPKEQGYTTTKVMKDAEFNPGRDAVGKGFMADLFETLDKQGVDEALRDSVSQLYLSSLPDLSWAKHGIHRKGTPGFSQDARRAFAQNMFHGARYLAKLRYADQMQTQLDEMQDHIKAYSGVEEYDGVQAQQVVDEMVKRHDFMMNPKVSPVSTALTSIGFVFHLGLSPASAMVNLSQTALVAYPIMGAKWGFTRASTALLKASREVVQAKNDLSKALKGDELDAFNKAVKDGTIDVTMAHDLAGISQGEDQKVVWAMRPVMRAASFMFHHAERFNRQATFMAAYRLSKESGKSPEVAYEEAKKATYDGHYDYAASNRPRLMQGNWQKVIFLFKQYAQNMIYTLSRNAYLSVKGLDPAQRSEARKALAGILSAHAAAAGVLGLPLVGPLLAAASFIGGDDDEPWDAEVAMQNMMAEAFGPKAAEVIARGFSRLTPFDLSGRVALNKLILPDVYEGLEGQQWAESFLAGAAGPVAGIFTGMIKGLQKIMDGDYQRGLEDMMPAALRGPLKALRYGSEGAVDKSGVVILDEVGPAGVASQALGFSPSNVRRSTERKGAIMDYDRALADRRSTLMRQWSEARMTGDDDGVRDVMEEIRAFNQKNPRRAITPPNLLQSYRARMKRINEADEGVYLPKNRRDAMDQVRF